MSMADVLIHKVRFVARGKTLSELQALATQEFTKVFEGQTFTMTVVGYAREHARGHNGCVLWEQEYEAFNG